MKRSKRKRTVHACVCQVCEQHPYSGLAQEHRAINHLLVNLDEKERRRLVGLLALKPEPRGVQRLIEVTGLSRNTIVKGRREVSRLEAASQYGRTRRTGGGRKAVEKNTPRS